MSSDPLKFVRVSFACGIRRKVSFVVTIFLSLAVFLTIVSGEIPENSESISLLNAYVFTSTIMSTLTVIITIIEIRIHSFGPDKSIPTCLMNIFTKLWGSSQQIGVIIVNETNNVNVDSVKKCGKRQSERKSEC